MGHHCFAVTLGDGCRQEGHLYSGTIKTVETDCHIFLGFIKQPGNHAAGTLDGVLVKDD